MTFRSLIAAAFCASALVLANVAPAAADEAAWLFDPGAVVEIDLEISQASIDALEAEPDEYQPANFTLRKAGGGTFGPTTVGLRLKGGLGSFRPLTEKAGFKIKFNEFVKGQKFLGLKKLTLNNMVQDPSMLHETLVYDLFRDLKVPASRTGYAFVRVNGDPYGVYLNLETLDDVSLPQWFSSTQHLYEADAPGVDVRTGEAGTFEVDEGEEADRTDLEALIAAANDEVGDWSEGMAATADLNEMTRMWAVERYAAHWDGYAGVFEPPLPSGPFRPNNYYLHSLDSGLFQMMPWGTDQTWEKEVEFDEPAGGLLFNECLADASCAALYEQALAEVQAAVPALELDAKAICTADRLAPWQAMEDASRREYDAAEIQDGVAVARAFMAGRPEELADWLGTTPPKAPSGEAPCPPEITPPPPGPRGDPPPAQSKPVTPLRLRGVELSGRTLTAQLDVPAPGRAAILAKTLGKGRSTACSGEADAPAAGAASVSCRLSKAVRRRLAARWLKLRLEVTFKTPAGAIDSASRTIRLPRR
jgi:hypothetical protein